MKQFIKQYGNSFYFVYGIGLAVSANKIETLKDFHFCDYAALPNLLHYTKNVEFIISFSFENMDNSSPAITDKGLFFSEESEIKTEKIFNIVKFPGWKDIDFCKQIYYLNSDYIKYISNTNENYTFLKDKDELLLIKLNSEFQQLKITILQKNPKIIILYPDRTEKFFHDYILKYHKNNLELIEKPSLTTLKKIIRLDKKNINYFPRDYSVWDELLREDPNLIFHMNSPPYFLYLNIFRRTPKLLCLFPPVIAIRIISEYICC
jgi:hypothetical protein